MITVDSQLGKGATFTIYLPESEQLNLPEKPQVETLIKGEGTILLVDDEDIIIDVSQAMLTVLGYQVVAARTGQEAVLAVERQGAGIDLVILDMIMPRMDGAKVFEVIRRIRPGCPCCLPAAMPWTTKQSES
jgi:response regulator RpfG family c-di-GMP phosphodiesterase